MEQDENKEPSLEATYPEIREYYAKQEFDKRFPQRLSKAIKEEYNEDVAAEIEKSIADGVIEVLNPALFFNFKSSIEDPSYSRFHSMTSLEQYLKETIFGIKELEEFGARKIYLNDLILNIALIIQNYKTSNHKIQVPNFRELINGFLFSIAQVGKSQKNATKIYIIIPDENLIKEQYKLEDFDMDNYYQICNAFMYSLAGMSSSRFFRILIPPVLHYAKGIYGSFIEKRKTLLRSYFQVDKEVVDNVVENLSPFEVNNTETENALDYLIAVSPNPPDINEVKKKLEVLLSNSNPMYNDESDFIETSFANEESYKEYSKVRPSTLYVDSYIARHSKNGAVSTVLVNCRKILGNRELVNLVERAHKINMLRYKYIDTPSKKLPTKIILNDVEFWGFALLKDLEAKRKRLEEASGKKITLEVRYRKNAGSPMIHNKQIVKDKFIRVISDIHADINEEDNFMFDFLNDFVVCCGDISGDCATTTKWIKNNIKKGVFVHGNHLGYSHPNSRGYLGYDVNPKDTVTNQIKELQEEFGNDKSVRYLNNSCYEYEGIVFLGCCLYTDFLLYGAGTREESMRKAKVFLNDFRYVKLLKNGEVVDQEPEDYVEMHERSKKFLYDMTLKYIHKPIVIVTHHAPLPQSISKEYEGSPINPAFVNDMKDLLDSRDNIRLWCHGHVHSPFEYTYRKTKIVCEPLGYHNENGYNIPVFGKRFKIETIKDEKKWELALSRTRKSRTQ